LTRQHFCDSIHINTKDELEAKKYIGQQVRFLDRSNILYTTIPISCSRELRAIHLDDGGTWYIDDCDDYYCGIAVEI
jgi:hypothetical protein